MLKMSGIQKVEIIEFNGRKFFNFIDYHFYHSIRSSFSLGYDKRVEWNELRFNQMYTPRERDTN